MVGREGVAVTTLRPSGKAEFDGAPMQVVTQGEMIDEGESIKVIEVTGNRITVVRA
jgi:membrane-bound serine protease (ClpP class)